MTSRLDASCGVICGGLSLTQFAGYPFKKLVPKGPPPLPSRILAQNVVEELWFGDDDPIRSHIEASSSLAATTALVTGLKPFPAAAQRVLRMSRDPDGKIGDMCRVIESDPGLLTRVLRVANSALYAPTRPVTSAENAIVRLGMRNVAQIVVALVATGMFSDVDEYGATIRAHCVGVSVLVRRLAVEVKAIAPEDVFLCGLLHDIGKLLALQSKELDYRAIDEASPGFSDESPLIERRKVGWDHAVLGAHVIEQWQLPRSIAVAVALHHQPGRAYAEGGEVAQSVALLRLADRIEYQMHLNRAPDNAFFDQLERSGAFEYTSYDGSILRAAWPSLLSAVDEGRAVLGRAVD
jgi:putative nucleotidyltransferase with HDIG domain